jgi:hypothetical protein
VNLSKNKQEQLIRDEQEAVLGELRSGKLSVAEATIKIKEINRKYPLAVRNSF